MYIYIYTCLYIHIHQYSIVPTSHSRVHPRCEACCVNRCSAAAPTSPAPSPPPAALSPRPYAAAQSPYHICLATAPTAPAAAHAYELQAPLLVELLPLAVLEVAALVRGRLVVQSRLR